MAGKGSVLGKGTSHGIYVPPERQEAFRRALRKIQRRRPGHSNSDIFIDSVIAEVNRYQDIPGLDDLPLDPINGRAKREAPAV
jgi:hypothetical protein